MSRIRTAALLIGLAPGIASAGLYPETPDARAVAFADCAGRFLALEEHERLWNGEASEQTAKVRNYFLDLLHSIEPFAIEAGLSPSEVTDWRVRGRADQRTLLMQAEFSTDQRIRRPAKHWAKARIDQCRALIPDV